MIVLGPGSRERSDRHAQALGTIIPYPVWISYAEASENPPPLFPEEDLCVARAVPTRQREFALGRWCARAALAGLGKGDAVIPMEPNRAPRWPAGCVGSITHCQGFVAAVVATVAQVTSIGLDVEQALPLANDLVPLICRPEERNWVDAAPPPPVGNWAKVLFSAKEAIHKCVSPVSGVMLDFHDVRVSLELETGRFRARLVDGDPVRTMDLSRIEGRFALTTEFVYAAAVISGPRGGSP